MKSDIIVIGGGTGGHLFPAIAVLEEINRRNISGSLVTDHRCEKYLKNHGNLDIHFLRSPKPARNILYKIYTMYLTLITIFRSYRLINKLDPKLVIGFGGYVSYPILLIARYKKIPILLHEQNCYLGRVNHIFSKYAVKLCLTSESTSNIPKELGEDKIVVSGNPVRTEILERLSKKSKANKDEFKILITGGSQGARFLSAKIPEIINIIVKQNPKKKFVVNQQARPEDIDELKSKYKQYKIEANISDFFFNIPELLSNCDLFIGRAGASTISEIIASSTISMLVPYPYAADKHQHFNARMIHDARAGFYFDQDDINTDYIAKKLSEVISNEDQANQIKTNLKKLQKNSSNIIVDTAEQIMKELGEKA